MIQREENVRRKASIIYGYALKKGTLVKSLFCDACGGPGPIDGHHENYTKPLDVWWLCFPCHIQADWIRWQRLGIVLGYHGNWHVQRLEKARLRQAKWRARQRAFQAKRRTT